MNPRMDVPARLVHLAELQSQVVTAEQAYGHGLTRHALGRLTASGQWQRLTVGVYSTVPTTPDWPALAWAGVLLGGDRARLGPRSSGFLHGLSKIAPEPVDVLVPGSHRVRVTGPWTFIRDQTAGRSTRSVGSPPRLPAADAVIDLTTVVRPGEVVSVVTTAVREGIAHPEQLLSVLSRRARHPQRALLVAMLEDVADGAESALELMFVRDVERPHGLPRGRRQKSRLGLPYCSDVGYNEFALLVELDGQDGHTGIDRFRDMRRDNRFAVRGRTTLRYGFYDVADHPCLVAGEIW